MKLRILVLLSLVGMSYTAFAWDWKLHKAADATLTGEEVSSPTFVMDSSATPDAPWLDAPVPGTVALAYTRAGLLEDIRYDDNLTRIDDDYFNADFWYRTSLDVPALAADERLILNFDGINWKAEIYVNGLYVGRIDGSFKRTHFDITSFLQRGGDAAHNILAVKIIHNANPGEVKIPTLEKNVPNGGVLGQDNPTFHASIGWDWIPTMPGRNIGIWNDVTLTVAKGGITIGDTFFDTTLPGTTPRHLVADKAQIDPIITMNNYGSQPVDGRLRITFGPKTVEQPVSIAPGTHDIDLDAFILDHPQLWWPVGYGDPHLYDVTVTFLAGGKELCQKTTKCGVRHMQYTLEQTAMQMFINGRRFIGHGGNWGFSECNLNYTARDYDIALAYHADMHLNFIRNWVGMVGDEEFYEACDKHGVMVWQDFWLANPYDGPNPNDETMFMDNANDMVHKTRVHPCIALYCGRNEGNPPTSLSVPLSELVADLCPNNLYISHSAEYNVSGYGPYRALSPQEIYDLPRGRKKMHSERGYPCVPTYESMCRMFRPEHRWPQNDVWAMHNFTLKGAQRCETYNGLIANGLGEAQNLKEYADRAQWVNYNGFRAMFESRSNYRNGLLLWMSHSAWPCLVFQTYDYYFDVNGAYFGSKKACAPIHISWNPLTNEVEVVNECAGQRNGLTAEAQVVDMSGRQLWHASKTIDAAEDATVRVFPIGITGDALSEVYFIKLVLKDGDRVIADNFYWEGREPGNWQAIQQMDKAQLATRVEQTDAETLTVTVTNESTVPALMLRLNLVNGKDGEQILPAFYDDNYFSLLGGETKTIRVRYLAAEHPAVSKKFKPTVTVEMIK